MFALLETKNTDSYSVNIGLVYTEGSCGRVACSAYFLSLLTANGVTWAGGCYLVVLSLKQSYPEYVPIGPVQVYVGVVLPLFPYP